jgi:amphi-Trp domain-containing protein
MGKEHFEFARVASPEEVAEYLSSLAVGLKRGELSLESGERVLRLSPAADCKLDIKVKQKASRGKLELEIGWKRADGARTTELRVGAGSRPDR